MKANMVYRNMIETIRSATEVWKWALGIVIGGACPDLGEYDVYDHCGCGGVASGYAEEYG